jgi:hypothetical protein
MNNLPARLSAGSDIANYGVARRTNRQLDHVHGRSNVTLARIEAATEEAAALVQARDALGAAAAQADAMLSHILYSLPVMDESDVAFRRGVQQATRAMVIGDIYRFGS